MKPRIALLAVSLITCLTGCDKFGSGPENKYKDALVVKTVKSSVATRADNGMVSKDGTYVFPIGSVFVGGAIAEPSKGSSHRCHFYTEKFTEGPNWDDVPCLVYIGGFRWKDVEYTKPGQYIDYIVLNFPNEIPGLGTLIRIPMEQGKYNGGNELIKNVKINSYQFASFVDYSGAQNKDADIDIVITTTAGDKLSLVFKNDVTPYDGYY